MSHPRRDRGNSFCSLLIVPSGALLIPDACPRWWEQICSSVLIQQLICPRKHSHRYTQRSHLPSYSGCIPWPAKQHWRCPITAQSPILWSCHDRVMSHFFLSDAYTQPILQIISESAVSLHLPFLSHHSLLISCQDVPNWIPNAYFPAAWKHHTLMGAYLTNPRSGLKVLTFPR